MTPIQNRQSANKACRDGRVLETAPTRDLTANAALLAALSGAEGGSMPFGAVVGMPSLVNLLHSAFQSMLDCGMSCCPSSPLLPSPGEGGCEGVSEPISARIVLGEANRGRENCTNEGRRLWRVSYLRPRTCPAWKKRRGDPQNADEDLVQTAYAWT